MSLGLRRFVDSHRDFADLQISFLMAHTRRDNEGTRSIEVSRKRLRHAAEEAGDREPVRQDDRRGDYAIAGVAGVNPRCFPG